MTNENNVGVKNYEQFDPGFKEQTLTTRNVFDESKLAYLRKNILPHLNSLAPDASILEIGPGHGALLHLLKQSSFQKVTGFEVCELYAKRLSALGFQVQNGDSAIRFLADSTERFQAIVMIDVLEHLERNEAFDLIKQCHKCLAPQGKLIIQLPNLSGVFGTTTFFGDFTHRTGYNEYSLHALLYASGFLNEHVALLPLQLPTGVGNLARSLLRELIYAAVRVVTRIVGAPPVRILTHNLIAVAQK